MPGIADFTFPETASATELAANAQALQIALENLASFEREREIVNRTPAMVSATLAEAVDDYRHGRLSQNDFRNLLLGIVKKHPEMIARAGTWSHAGWQPPKRFADTPLAFLANKNGGTEQQRAAPNFPTKASTRIPSSFMRTASANSGNPPAPNIATLFPDVSREEADEIAALFKRWTADDTFFRYAVTAITALDAWEDKVPRYDRLHSPLESARLWNQIYSDYKETMRLLKGLLPRSRATLLEQISGFPEEYQRAFFHAVPQMWREEKEAYRASHSSLFFEEQDAADITDFLNERIMEAVAEATMYFGFFHSPIKEGFVWRRVSGTPALAEQFIKGFNATASGYVEAEIEGRPFRIARDAIREVQEWHERVSFNDTIGSRGKFRGHVVDGKTVLETFVPEPTVVGSFSLPFEYSPDISETPHQPALPELIEKMQAFLSAGTNGSPSKETRELEFEVHVHGNDYLPDRPTHSDLRSLREGEIEFLMTDGGDLFGYTHRAMHLLPMDYAVRPVSLLESSGFLTKVARVTEEGVLSVPQTKQAESEKAKVVPFPMELVKEGKKTETEAKAAAKKVSVRENQLAKARTEVATLLQGESRYQTETVFWETVDRVLQEKGMVMLIRSRILLMLKSDREIKKAVEELVERHPANAKKIAMTQINQLLAFWKLTHWQPARVFKWDRKLVRALDGAILDLMTEAKQRDVDWNELRLRAKKVYSQFHPLFQQIQRFQHRNFERGGGPESYVTFFSSYPMRVVLQINRPSDKTVSEFFQFSDVWEEFKQTHSGHF